MEADIPPAVLGRIRTICLALPEAAEKETWGHPTFRVADKIFASAGIEERDESRVVTMGMKAAPGEQKALLAAGHPYFYPKYVGSKGWIGIVIDRNTDWAEIAELVEDSYRAIAPRRLVIGLDQD